MKLQTFAQIAKRLPGRTGQGVHPATLWRWHRAGLDTPHGRVRLKAVKAGGIYCTSWPWLCRFFRELEAPPATDTMEPKGERARRLAAADAEADALGY
jgi:hypothetical protein